MKDEFIKLSGKEKGTTSVILAGVHGNERCGVEALEKLLPTLEIASGEVWFGYGNPHAIAINKRFTESNLNRMFKSDDLISAADKKSYEYARAQVLKQYFDKADALLDVHATSIPNSRTFAFCEPNAKEIVEYLPVEIAITNINEVEPGGTDYYMHKRGKIGITVECGYIHDPKGVTIAEESILAFLAARGHIPNTRTPQPKPYIRMYELYLTKTDNFTLAKPFENFEGIETSQLIGTDGEEEVRAKNPSVVLFAHTCNKVGQEAFLLGETVDKTP